MEKPWPDTISIRRFLHETRVEGQLSPIQMIEEGQRILKCTARTYFDLLGQWLAFIS